jgi:hypothetical protein
MDSDRIEYARSMQFDLLKGFEGRVIEKLRGAGQVALPKGPAAECAFECIKLDDGRVMVECHLLAGAIRELMGRFGPRRGDGIVEGHTAEGSDVRIEGAAVVHLRESVGQDEPEGVKMLLSCDEIHVSMPVATGVRPARLTYGLTNLEFLGDERTDFPCGGWARDKFRFRAASTDIIVRWVDGYREIVQQVKSARRMAVTAEASLDVEDGVVDVRQYDDMMDVVCTLMSLAKGNRVAWIYTKMWDKGGGLISMEMPGNVAAPWCSAGALIGGSTARELKEFIAHSYEPYLEVRDIFNLPVAIGYYLASKSQSEIYTKFLLACSAMETLLSNFAQKGAQGDVRYIVPEEEFKDKRKVLEGLLSDALLSVFPRLSRAQVDDARVKVAEINRRSYRRVVRKMLEELGVDFDRRADLRFINLRHKVVHTGVLGADVRESFRHYSGLIELLDRIFLKILQYDGGYLRYSDQMHFIAR